MEVLIRISFFVGGKSPTTQPKYGNQIWSTQSSVFFVGGTSPTIEVGNMETKYGGTECPSFIVGSGNMETKHGGTDKTSLWWVAIVQPRSPNREIWIPNMEVLMRLRSPVHATAQKP